MNQDEVGGQADRVSIENAVDIGRRVCMRGEAAAVAAAAAAAVFTSTTGVSVQRIHDRKTEEKK